MSHETPPTPRMWAIAPQFVVPDVARAAAYYRDVLGFQVGEFFGDPPVFVIINRNAAIIQLGKSDTGATTPNTPARRVGLDAYIWVRNVDALAEEFRARGARIVEGPIGRIYGIRELTVDDPDGYRLVFGEPTVSEANPS